MLKEQIVQFEAIVRLDAQRSVLGDAVVEVALAALRQQLFWKDAVIEPVGQDVILPHNYLRRRQS